MLVEEEFSAFVARWSISYHFKPLGEEAQRSNLVAHMSFLIFIITNY